MIRWITRVISLLVALLFVVFFIGEGLFNNISELTIPEILGVVCIIFFILGSIIAWKKEIIGGIVIIISIILFNVITMIEESSINIEIDFEMFIIFGILFIICGMIDKLQLDKKI